MRSRRFKREIGSENAISLFDVFSLMFFFLYFILLKCVFSNGNERGG